MKDDRSDLLGSLFSEDADAIPDPVVTERIIGCAFTVSNTLGTGFLEKVYENALAHELRKAGFAVEQQKRINVYYDSKLVGFYDADIVVDGRIIIEVKALRALEDAHKAQTINYLKSTGLRLGLLINFGSARVEIKRVAL